MMISQQSDSMSRPTKLPLRTLANFKLRPAARFMTQSNTQIAFDSFQPLLHRFYNRLKSFHLRSQIAQLRLQPAQQAGLNVRRRGISGRTCRDCW
jgi:hypothetical protein